MWPTSATPICCLAIGHRLYEAGESWLSGRLKDDLDRWSAEVSQVTTRAELQK